MTYILLQGSASAIPLADESVQCIVTSPPYWGLRQYAGEQREVWGGDPEHAHEWGAEVRTPWANSVPGPNGAVKNRVDGSQEQAKWTGPSCQCVAWYGALGLEPTPDLYVEHMVAVFRELWRVLRPDGVAWLNLGDTFYSGPDGGTNYGRGGRGARGVGHGAKNEQVAEHLAPRRREAIPGYRPKSRLLLPHRVAIALADDGWIVRMDNVWAKPNPMPDSTEDRTTPAHEYVFQLVKQERYYYDKDAILEPLAASSLARITQETFDQQHGGEKDYANGTNPARSARGTLEHFRDKTLATPHAGGRRQAPEPGEPGWANAAGRNARSVWTIATVPYPGAHFATFPEAIPERCILASTSPTACGVCGAPWARQVESVRTVKGEPADLPAMRGDGDAPYVAGGPRHGDIATVRTSTGWAPTCTHDDASGACVVLDPFNGSGTTGAVAIRLGRSYVGLDISREYLHDQALHRLDPLAGQAQDTRESGLGQGVLFT